MRYPDPWNVGIPGGFIASRLNTSSLTSRGPEIPCVAPLVRALAPIESGFLRYRRSTVGKGTTAEMMHEQILAASQRKGKGVGTLFLFDIRRAEEHAVVATMYICRSK